MEEEIITQQGSAELEDTKYEQSTVCDHFMAWESENIAVCANGCGHGCMVDPKQFDIVNGKIVDKA